MYLIECARLNTRKSRTLIRETKLRDSGLLIFHAVAEPWNSGKSAKSREMHKNPKIPRNSVEILSNTCLYNIFETYFSYRGYLLAVNLQIYLETSSLKCANNIPKLPGIDYVAKNWALAMMLKTLPLVHFWSVLLSKEEMMTSVRKTLKTLVWSVQNQLISSEIWLENNYKIGCFYWLLFGEVCPENSRKIPAKSADFSANFSLKIPQNLTFSSATYQKSCWLPESKKRNEHGMSFQSSPKINCTLNIYIQWKYYNTQPVIATPSAPLFEILLIKILLFFWSLRRSLVPK